MIPSGSSSQNTAAEKTSKNWKEQVQHLCWWWLTPPYLYLQIFVLLLPEASLLHASVDVSASKNAETLPEENSEWIVRNSCLSVLEWLQNKFKVWEEKSVLAPKTFCRLPNLGHFSGHPPTETFSYDLAVTQEPGLSILPYMVQRCVRTLPPITK